MRYLICIFLAGLIFSARSQQIMKGIVVDSASFAPLAFVNVQVKNTGRGTATDVRGNFGVIAGVEDTLLFSLLGYKPLELPLSGYEPSLIRMAEKPMVLPLVTVDDYRLDNAYEGMFDDQNVERLRQRIPFYYSRARKDQIRAGRWREESLHVQTYVDVVINDPATKADLMKLHALTEEEYYEILTRFNEKHYQVMYFLTSAELKSFLNRFFEREANR